MKHLLSFGVLGLVLAACASTRILPQVDGNNLIVASSASESAAYDAALEDAQKFCAKQGRRFAMVSQQSNYNGMDKNVKGVIGAVALMTMANPHQHNMYGATSSHDDYRVEVTFKCQ